MSKADQQFVTMCRDILDHGTTTEGQKVRPVWEDGTPAYTIKNFGVTARYDLREEFPALTLRRTASNLLWTRSCGSIKRSPITCMTSTAIFGMSGLTRPAPSARPTVSDWAEEHYAEGDFDRWTACCTTLSTRRTAAAL